LCLFCNSIQRQLVPLFDRLTSVLLFAERRLERINRRTEPGRSQLYFKRALQLQPLAVLRITSPGCQIHALDGKEPHWKLFSSERIEQNGNQLVVLIGYGRLVADILREDRVDGPERDDTSGLTKAFAYPSVPIGTCRNGLVPEDFKSSSGKSVPDKSN